MFGFIWNAIDSIAGKARVVKNLGDIRWIERQTETYFNTSMESLKADADYLKKMASEAGKRSKLVSSIYKSLGKIEEAKLDANSAGIDALSSVQSKRLAYRSKKQKLLEIAAKKRIN